MLIKFDIIQTLSLSVIVFIAGEFIKKKIQVLEQFSIPAPVIGGILFSFVSLWPYYRIL